MEAGRVALTDHEREWVALMIGDAVAMPDTGAASRLIEGRLATLLAARGERGYHEGWSARSGIDLELCTCGHYHHPDNACAQWCGCRP